MALAISPISALVSMVMPSATSAGGSSGAAPISSAIIGLLVLRAMGRGGERHPVRWLAARRAVPRPAIAHALALHPLRPDYVGADYGAGFFRLACFDVV